MPGDYQYKLTITTTIDNRGVISGTKELDSQLSKTEKRALKMAESVKKAFAALEKTGFNSAKVEAYFAKTVTADEKALRAIRQSEAQKIKLTEQTRREHIKTADLSARAVERSTQAQIKAERNAARETERAYQSRTKFAVDYAAKQERFDQARFRSAQMYYREQERLANAESRRLEKLNRDRERASARRIENVGTIGGGLQSAGLIATSIATTPIVAAFYTAIKVGAEYEQSMNMLQAVTSATAEEMERAGELAG